MKATMKFELPNKENYFLENIFQESSELMDGQETTVWPDLVKFHHFGIYLKIFGNIFKVYLVTSKVSDSL